MTSLQRPKTSAELPSGFGFHPETDNNVSFRHAVPVGRDSSERYANYSVFLGNFGDEIGPQRSGAVIEDHNPGSVMVHFADCSDHAGSLS